ncbi:hypothetical protein GQ457_04G022770 [Hibiscus cannabinus]
MATNSNKEEPGTVPKPNRWYNISLGSSFKDQHQPFLKVTFEGANEDYKDNDEVLFFDGEAFQLERLHRAVKRLRHVRQPWLLQLALQQNLINHHLLQVECIETSDFESGESRKEKNSEFPLSILNKPSASPDGKGYKSEEQVDIVNDDNDNDGLGISEEDSAFENVSIGVSIDINEPRHSDMDDEIADVDVSDDEEQNVGQSAAEALRARVNAEEHSSSASSSSGSESRDSESSDGGDSVISI